MPAGMPPGVAYPSEEKAPEAVLYFRIYAVIVCIIYGLFTLAGGGMVVAPLFLDHSKAADAEIGFLFAGALYGGIGLLHLVPTLVALFGGRRPWVHVVGIIVLGLGMFNICCLPILIPLFVVWMKPETRRWFGAT
jgi:hypothetical protein